MSFAPPADSTPASFRCLRRIFFWQWIFVTILPLLIGCGTVTNRAYAGQPPSASRKLAGGNVSGLPGTSGYDGPAELPIATVASSMADTPAPGSVIRVAAGGDLQSALNNASCGDTVELEAGASFTGSFNLPALNCDSGHWIIVRTSAPNGALPAEGHRLTPCYAGVSSLPGRPQYACNNPRNVLAKIVLTDGGSSAVTFLAGANHYRLVGLELTQSGDLNAAPTLIAVSQGGTASYIVLDRSWLHGTTQDDTRNGFQLAGATEVAIVDSYFSDFHCTSVTGYCTEAHAISGGIGPFQDGPFKIDDNFLEASTQGILFGGGKASLTPTDITITRNHFWKPWQWMLGNQPFVGGKDGHPFVVKNHLEFKNAIRVLVDSNLMENCWGGFTQTGYGILLTPKNQHTPQGNVCPLCQVTDVTIRYVHVFHAGGGIALATGVSASGQGGAALAGTRWSIHDVVFDDISATTYVGQGNLFLISNGWPKNGLNTVTINHITGFPDPDRQMIFTGNLGGNASMYGLVFTNNLVISARYPIWSTGGGAGNCAFADVPVTTINNCFTTYTFSNNGLIAPPPRYKPSTWPSNNLFAQTIDDVKFINFNGGNGGNYRLRPSSPYKNKGTDGKDLGADILGLDRALQKVE